MRLKTSSKSECFEGQQNCPKNILELTLQNWFKRSCKLTFRTSLILMFFKRKYVLYQSLQIWNDIENN